MKIKHIKSIIIVTGLLVILLSNFITDDTFVTILIAVLGLLVVVFNGKIVALLQGNSKAPSNFFIAALPRSPKEDYFEDMLRYKFICYII